MAGRVYVSSFVAMLMAVSHASAFAIPPLAVPLLAPAVPFSPVTSLVPRGLSHLADQLPKEGVPLNRPFQLQDAVPGALTATAGILGANSAWPMGTLVDGTLAMPMGQVMGAPLGQQVVDMGAPAVMGTGMTTGVGTGMGGGYILTDIDPNYGLDNAGFITDGLGTNLIGGGFGDNVVIG